MPKFQKNRKKKLEVPEIHKNSLVITIRIDDYKNDRCFSTTHIITDHQRADLSQYVFLSLAYNTMQKCCEELWSKFYEFITSL
jgi:hypothetical protein